MNCVNVRFIFKEAENKIFLLPTHKSNNWEGEKKRSKKHMKYITEHKKQASNGINEMIARKDLTALWEVGFSTYHMKILI